MRKLPSVRSSSLKETPDDERGEAIPARGLGVDGVADFDTGLGQDAQFKGSSWEGSEYSYVWRTGNLLQVFVLSLSGPGVDEATARDFADTMAALAE